MILSCIKNLIPAPQDAEISYIQSTADEIPVNEGGYCTSASAGMQITLTQWKRVGANPAALSSEYYFGLQRISGSTVTNWGTPLKTNTITLSGRDIEGYDSIRAFLIDDNNHEVASRTIRANKQGEQGPTGPTGPGGVYYDMRLSAHSVVKHQDNSITPSSVSVSIYKRQGNGGLNSFTGFVVVNDALNNVLYADYFSSFTLSLSSSTAFPVRIRMWESEANSSGTPVAEEYIHVVSDGENGKTGRMFYLAGEYSSTKTYNRTDDLCPVVLSNGYYYYLKKDSNVVSGTHYAPGNTTYWELANNFNMIFTEALFASFAKLGSFVVSGDFFISQYGTLYEGSTASVIGNSNYSQTVGGHLPYTYFDSSDPWVNTLPSSGNYKFRPALVINARTGETYQNNSHVRGEVHATSGTFTNVNVQGNITIQKQYMLANVVENGVLACGCIVGFGTYTLPPIQSGSFIEVKVFFPCITRLAVNLDLYTSNGDIFIYDFGNDGYADIDTDPAVTHLGLTYGYYELLGFEYGSDKVWYISKISNL